MTHDIERYPKTGIPRNDQWRRHKVAELAWDLRHVGIRYLTPQETRDKIRAYLNRYATTLADIQAMFPEERP